MTDAGQRPKSRPKSGKPQPQAAEPMKPGYPARAAAAKMLSAVVEQKTPLDGMIDEDHGNPAFRALSPQDRALVRAILNSALRHLSWIDAIFARFLEKPLPEGAKHLRHVLSVAAAQILFLDAPDHSAVDIAVEQARRDPRSRRFANLVNALLRRLSREKEDVLTWAKAQVPIFPAWFLGRLEGDYGPAAAAAIGNAFIALAPIDLTVKSDPDRWAGELGGTVLPTGSVRLDKFHGAVSDLPGFAEGAWWVQDAAAAIPARLMGDIRGKRVADLCAAPGGKTMQLAAKGASVVALDRSKNRLKRVEENLERTKLSADIQMADAENYEDSRQFDVVLLDAPCSATGTFRRQPDVLWATRPADIAKLADVQHRLLDSAAKRVKIGGDLVYSTCSLEREEGETQILAFLRRHPDFSLVKLLPEKAADMGIPAESVRPEGWVRLLPHQRPGGQDGFFIARLKRNKVNP